MPGPPRRPPPTGASETQTLELYLQRGCGGKPIDTPGRLEALLRTTRGYLNRAGLDAAKGAVRAGAYNIADIRQSAGQAISRAMKRLTCLKGDLARATLVTQAAGDNPEKFLRHTDRYLKQVARRRAKKERRQRRELERQSRQAEMSIPERGSNAGRKEGQEARTLPFPAGAEAPADPREPRGQSKATTGGAGALRPWALGCCQGCGIVLAKGASEVPSTGSPLQGPTRTHDFRVDAQHRSRSLGKPALKPSCAKKV